MIDARLQKIFAIYEKRCKAFVKATRNPIAVAQQEKFVATYCMPPMFGVAYADYSKRNFLILCNNLNYFESKDIDALLQYFDDKIFVVFSNENTTDLQKREAFVRATCFGYMVDELIEILLERDNIVDDDQFIQYAKSHRNALINFIESVSERHARTGKFGVSGSNIREIEEMRNMGNAMLKGIYIGEWYTAYTLAYFKYLCCRLGGTSKDWE